MEREFGALRNAGAARLGPLTGFRADRSRRLNVPPVRGKQLLRCRDAKRVERMLICRVGEWTVDRNRAVRLDGVAVEERLDVARLVDQVLQRLPDVQLAELCTSGRVRGIEVQHDVRELVWQPWLDREALRTQRRLH